LNLRNRHGAKFEAFDRTCTMGSTPLGTTSV
jgi:hypothetical protein